MKPFLVVFETTTKKRARLQEEEGWTSRPSNGKSAKLRTICKGEREKGYQRRGKRCGDTEGETTILSMKKEARQGLRGEDSLNSRL